MRPPSIEYARSADDVSIAFSATGQGSIDLVFVHGFASHLIVEAREPRRAAFFDRLRRFARVIEFDRRGTGLSDRVDEVPTLEARMDDLRSVMDAAGVDHAAIFATFEAASMAMLFAATSPDRVVSLAVYNPVIRGDAPDTSTFGGGGDALRMGIHDVAARWGTEDFAREWVETTAPSLADDRAFVLWAHEALWQAATPQAAAAIFRMAVEVDITEVLPAIRVPTLLLHRPWARDEIEEAARRMPDARAIEIGGPDLLYFIAEGLGDELERFVIETWRDPEPDRALATLLFTDIVGSTAMVAELGDRRWAELIERHNAAVRVEVERFRGREIDTAGDGFFAAFDGPVRAVRCARRIAAALEPLGLRVRAGVHTGEVELADGKPAGMAVNVGARVAAHAGPGEVLVSEVVKDLVAGSGLSFADRGEADLKGVPGHWRLWALEHDAR